MPHIMWNALAKQPNGAQGVDWGTSIVMGDRGSELTIAAADILTMIIFCLDTAVANEARSPGGDTACRDRNALGGSSGASYSGHTASVVAGRGVVLVHTASGNSFDVGNPSSFARAIASLCNDAIPTTSGLLMRA